MRFDKPRSWVPETRFLDVTMVLESKSGHPEDLRKMTETQIAINLHHCCPHLTALIKSDPFPPGHNYTKKKVVCIAKVVNAKSSGSAIDIVSNEVTRGCLDRRYIVRSVNIKVRRRK